MQCKILAVPGTMNEFLSHLKVSQYDLSVSDLLDTCGARYNLRDSHLKTIHFQFS